MKYLPLALCLAAAACGPVPPIALVVSADATTVDIANLRGAVSALNGKFGCPVATLGADPEASPVKVSYVSALPSSELGFYDPRAIELVDQASLVIARDLDPLDTAYIGNLTQRQVLHELGHAFGLAHTSAPSDIMYAADSGETVSDEVWASYAAQLRRVGVTCQP